MQYFIDTNVFLRVLLSDDQIQFTQCTDFLSAIKENKIEACTATVVLSEIAWTLNSYYKFSKDLIVRSIRSIINFSGIKIMDNYDQQLALNLFEKHSIKYIDAVIASITLIAQKEITIVSFDRDFKKLPVLSLTPGEVIKREKL